jgi:hypothetical protein
VIREVVCLTHIPREQSTETCVILTAWQKRLLNLSTEKEQQNQNKDTEKQRRKLNKEHHKNKKRKKTKTREEDAIEDLAP